jgi:sec-independent protein translocase protein TatA
MPNLGGWEFVILIGVLVLLFGAKRLPDMARSIGQSARVFKGEMKGMRGADRRTGRARRAASHGPVQHHPAAGPAGDVGGDPAGQPARSEPTRAVAQRGGQILPSPG